VVKTAAFIISIAYRLCLPVGVKVLHSLSEPSLTHIYFRVSYRSPGVTVLGAILWWLLRRKQQAVAEKPMFEAD
jgi:hypothetical protein